MIVRRVPPVPSPVLVEAYEILRGRGYDVEDGIAEELPQRPDLLVPEHDLYILKSHTELSLSLAGVLHAQGANLLTRRSSATECATCRVRSPGSRFKVHRNARAREGVLEQAGVVLRRPQGDGHPIEEHTAPGLPEDAWCDFHALAPLSGRREHLRQLEEDGRGRSGG